MKHIYRIIHALPLTVVCTAAYAFNLGEIHGGARIGEPFEAYVNIYTSPDEELATVRLEVLPDLAFYGNRSLTGLVDDLDASIVIGAANRGYIRIRGNRPVDEPLVAFRLKAIHLGGASIRHYAVAPAPAVRAAEHRAVRRAATGTLNVNGSEYGPVRRGESLWRIARAIAGNGNANLTSLVNSLFEANPQAFIGGDINKLKLGAVLKIPGGSAAVLRGDDNRGDAMAQPPLRAVTSPGIAVSGVAPAPVEQALAAAAPRATSSAAVDVRTADQALAQRLASLGAKFASIRARYGASAVAHDASSSTSGAGMAAPQPALGEPATQTAPLKPDGILPSETGRAPAAPTMAVTAATVATEMGAPTAVPVTAVVAPPRNAQFATATDGRERRSSSVSTSEAAPRPASVTATGLPDSLYTIAIYGCAGLVAVALVMMGARRVSAFYGKRTAGDALQAAEEERKADVQRKAAKRLQMETEVRRMIDEKKKNRNGSSVAPLEPEAPTIERAADLTEAQADVGDRAALIDTNIAYGRYLEAKKLLLEVLLETPRNYAAKLRLVEVYYITEQVDGFVEVANDLHGSHRAEITDGDWQRIMRMGKIIAPDRAPFGGPQRVASGAEAS